MYTSRNLEATGVTPELAGKATAPEGLVLCQTWGEGGGTIAGHALIDFQAKIKQIL